MLIRRCAWHKPYRKILGIAFWLPLWKIGFTDCICSECAVVFRAENGLKKRATA